MNLTTTRDDLSLPVAFDFTDVDIMIQDALSAFENSIRFLQPTISLEKKDTVPAAALRGSPSERENLSPKATQTDTGQTRHGHSDDRPQYAGNKATAHTAHTGQKWHMSNSHPVSTQRVRFPQHPHRPPPRRPQAPTCHTRMRTGRAPLARSGSLSVAGAARPCCSKPTS